MKDVQRSTASTGAMGPELQRLSPAEVAALEARARAMRAAWIRTFFRGIATRIKGETTAGPLPQGV